MALSDATAYAVAHWTLDESSGTRADSVGSNDLADYNTVGVGTGKFGNAADFEASNSEYLYVTDNSDVSVGNTDWMFRAWVQLESIPSFPIIASKGWPTPSADAEFALFYRTSGGDGFELAVNIGTDSATAIKVSMTASTGTWYLIHAWHDATNDILGISVNAGTPTTTSYTAGVNDGTSNFVLGASPAQTLYWDGLIDDAVILKGYILDATERTADYNSGTGVAFADWSGGGGGSIIPKIMHHRRLMGVS